MLKVALEDLLRNPVGGEKGRRSVKTGSMNREKSNPVLEKVISNTPDSVRCLRARTF